MSDFEIKEKVILVAVQLNNGSDAEASLDELEFLAETAGAETVAKVIQNRESFHPGTYIGSGKIDEIRGYIEMLGATGIICDDELSPAQQKNLEQELDVKIMDRTIIILDIFAQRASTAEGKIQVELAQLKYRMTRLAGYGTSMSRLGGGIGTRGPGESKLETDRRRIRSRVSQLNNELKDVVRHREVMRSHRENNGMTVAAIVGYTNAGKSTLLNRLTGSDVLSEDKLFATLDPTTRKLTLPCKETILLTDTVGFINKLPHHLVDAFRSTLEEAKYSDLIIHVMDASNEEMFLQKQVVYETLDDLDITGKTIISLFNKTDLDIDPDVRLRDSRADYEVKISAKTGAGIDDFLDILSHALRETKIYIEKTFSYSEGGKVNEIRQYGQLIEEKYTENGIEVKAYVPKRLT